ncbi:hypothetical protein OEA41_002956 [Lepraria neglecta]|uniref:Uncharacterized protein n=1 Tax=Lepraria neglecta TaxID=209136 RepID=A0AAD9Z6T8_9LECA|nr:hypothetical protein OEA41_002956 [Lepraria neglecta]
MATTRRTSDRSNGRKTRAQQPKPAGKGVVCRAQATSRKISKKAKKNTASIAQNNDTTLQDAKEPTPTGQPTTTQGPYSGYTVIENRITKIPLPLMHEFDGERILTGEHFSRYSFGHPVIDNKDRARYERCPNCHFMLEDKRAVYSHFSRCVRWNGNRNAVSWYDNMDPVTLPLETCCRLMPVNTLTEEDKALADKIYASS